MSLQNHHSPAPPAIIRTKPFSAEIWRLVIEHARDMDIAESKERIQSSPSQPSVAVKAEDEEDVKNVLAGVGSHHQYELRDGGHHPFPRLEVLSRVNKMFSTMVNPLIWHTVNMRWMNNWDLLYFLKVVLPRRGRYIVSLKGINPSWSSACRSDVPLYLTNALLAPPQYPEGHPSRSLLETLLLDVGGNPPWPGRMDWELFESDISLAPPLKEPTDSHYEDREMHEWEPQRRHLLSEILESPKVALLRELDFELTKDSLDLETEDSYPLMHDMDTLRDSFSWRGRKITKLSLRAKPSLCSLTEEWLAQFVRLFPNLVSFHLGFSVIMMEYGEEPLLGKAIVSLKSLEELSLWNCPWMSGLDMLVDFEQKKSTMANIKWKSPLKILELHNTELNHIEFRQILQQVKGTLEELQINSAFKIEEGKPLLPFGLRKLHTLHIATSLNSSFLASFSSSPLRHIRIGRTPNITITDWKAFALSHRRTVKGLSFLSACTVSPEDQEELKTWARAGGFEVDFELEVQH